MRSSLIRTIATIFALIFAGAPAYADRHDDHHRGGVRIHGGYHHGGGYRYGGGYRGGGYGHHWVAHNDYGRYRGYHVYGGEHHRWRRYHHGAWSFSLFAPSYRYVPAYGNGYYWTYCPSRDAYYPDIRHCPGGWEYLPAEE